jgi:hypothetical protein
MPKIPDPGYNTAAGIFQTLKKKREGIYSFSLFSMSGGEGEIRTLGGLTLTGLANRRTKPTMRPLRA